MKNKVIKTALAIMLIIAITMSDIILVGKNLVTYAADKIKSSSNIEFTAYFKTEKGEESEAKYEMNNEEMKLYMKLAVEDGVGFDGAITLENSNFKFKPNVLSDAINKIEGNTITLNRVRAGNTVEIEVGIEPIIEKSYEANMLSKESVLKLTGNYYKDGTEESTSINAEKKVALTLLVPNNIEELTKLEAKTITNRIYKIGEANKRIVQIELNSEVVKNVYPIENTTFEVALPEGVESLEVISKGTYATNGAQERELKETTHYTWDKTNKLLQVTIKNENKDGKISWNQEGKDNIIVTLILSAEQEISEQEYSVKSNIEFYGEQEKQVAKEGSYNLTAEADGTIRASIENSENIYKGKIYSKEEREYSSTTNIEINYAKLIEGATIQEKAFYKTESEEEKAANIEYKTTTISKSEFERILGTEVTEEGKPKATLTIKDQNGNTVKEITSADFDTTGNATITYARGVTGITVEITKAVTTGVIRLNHTKVIKPENYTTEEIKTLKTLVEQSKVTYKDTTYAFEILKTLRELTAEVGITITPQTVSAEKNNEMQITVTLKTDNEKYELYKNPIFKFTLPEGVTANSVEKGTITATDEEFTISRLETNGREIILELAGKQQKYVTSDINPQITFKANLAVEKLMPNKQDRIQIEYLNKYINAEKVYELQSNLINIVASNSSVVTHLKVENYNNLGTILEKYSNGEAEVSGKVPMDAEEIIEAPVKYTIINNYNVPVTMKATIVANLTDKEENVKTIMNYSDEEVTVEAGSMQVIEQVLQIPAGLYFSEKISLESLVEYTYLGTEYSVPNTIKLATQEKEGIRDISIIDNKIQLETFMQLGNDAGVKATDEIYNEQIVKYIIEVTNISSEPISNLSITNNHENGNIYDLKEIEVSNIPVQEEAFIEHRYGELETNTKTFKIETLKPGESREVVCKVVAKKSEQSNITTANMSVSADGLQESKIAPISNAVKEANLKVASRRALNEEVQIYADSTYLILTTVKNLTGKEIKDTNVRIHLSEGLTYKNGYPIQALDENEQELDIIKDINYNKEENYIDLKITNLSANQEIILTSMLYIEKITSEETSKNVTVYLEVNNIASNDVVTNVKQMETQVTVVQNVDVAQGQKVKNNDKVIIKGEIENIGNIDSQITIQDKLPSGLEINKVTIIKNGEKIDKTEEVVNNTISTAVDMIKGETIIIEIEAIVNTSKIVTDTIENTISVKPFVGDEVTSNTITLTVESTIDTGTGSIGDYQKPEEPEVENPELDNPELDDPNLEKPNPENPEVENPDPDNPNPENPDKEDPDTEKPTPEEPKYTISGNVWVDKNKNTTKDNNEVLKGVVVKVVDLNNQNTFLKDENGKEIEVKTNENGEYKIEHVVKGKYNIIFKYDTSLYELSENSEIKDYIIESTKEKVAITNNINLDSNQTIDLRLEELKEFNLKIDKYISKVVVQTSKETKTIEYTNKQLVKEEIQTKYLSGATVLVEYTMKISNIGELSGYATEILDYLPSDMSFHSELNTQWYEGEDGNLYNTSLASEEINPGENKTVKLVLLKTMTKNNTGTTANIVEISDTMNAKEYADIDLNDNQSKAEIIINPATGSIITYLLVVINSILIVAVGAYIIKKRIIK